MTFRFLHASDLHLDTPFSGLTASAPDVVSALRDASLDAFDQLVRTAIARDVTFVLLVGNLYDGAERGVRAQVALRRGLGELADQGIRTFVVAGSTDPLEGAWSAVDDWPEHVTFFPAGELMSAVVERDGTPVATVHGSSASATHSDDLASRFSRTDGPGPHIAAVQGSLGDADPSIAAIADSVDDLVACEFDYWALGGAHEPQVVHREPWVVYPGILQARHQSAADRGARGAYLVEIDDGQILEPEFLPLDRVRFARVEHAIDGLSEIADLRERLVDLGRRHLAEADSRSVILRVDLVGRGPVHGELHRPGALVELVDALRLESLSDAPFLWWDRIDLATRPVHDLDELKGRNDFVADLVDETAKLLADDSARSGRVAGWDDELPSDLSHLLGGTLPDAADPDRWHAAQELAVDLVSSDES